uniref:Peptidase S8/S53 domain-containing protein n=1 Tax=Rhizophagus irregularis (strain DAOM 181602 / DAOM 197198 / MUCL 43194) TaxID=747089 RepID=U9T2Y3_RHIID
MLIKCLGRRVEKSSPGQGIFSSSSNNNKPDKNLITDHSTDGKFSIYSGFFDKKFVDTLSKRSDVNFVEKVIKIKANYAVNNTNLDRIDQKDFPLDGKYNYPTSAGSGVNVYVVDTGIDIKNAEFEGRASFGGSFCAGCSSTDDNGHGTNVAGIIGGKKYGVANKATLIAIKVLDQSGQGSSTTVVAGLSYVILQHSKSSNKKTVVNLSLGGAYSQAINQMISLCSNAGIHVVVSAGDDSSNACNVSPASAPQAITVGATEKSTNKITNLTNTGSCVKIFAPGVDIVAAGALLTNSLSKASGTSQACPHVAGTVALIISKKGNMNPSLMINELITLSTKNILTNLQNATPNRFLRIPSP